MATQTHPRTATPAAARLRRHAVTTICWLLVAPGLGWTVVRVGGLERHLMVQLIAFTPYVAAWTLVPLGLALVLRRWPAAIAAAVSALILLGLVAPRMMTDERPDATGPELRVLTANLLAGGADPHALLRLVRTSRVDILALQEFTPEAAAELDRLGLPGLLPYRQLNPMFGVPGSALYTRFPLSNGGARRNAGGFTQAYGTLTVPGAPPLLVESVHPKAPIGLRDLGFWRDDLLAEPPATPDGPLRILAGDFNSTLDHAPLRTLLATGYVDAAEATGSGLTGTWGPYDGDRIPPVTIDHVLVDRRIAVREVSVHPLPRSDHRPVLASLTLPASP